MTDDDEQLPHTFYELVGTMQASELREWESKLAEDRRARDELRAASGSTARSLSQINEDADENKLAAASLAKDQARIDQEVAAVTAKQQELEKKPEGHFPPPPMKHPA